MTCPFLREAQVKYCETASVRKLIPIGRGGRPDEKCSSADHGSCSIYRAQPATGSASGICPHLRESLMQYCAAAPVAKMVPYSESLLSRCGNDSFRYCELYHSMAHPNLRAEEVDGIAMPGWLRYSANHMWLDVTGDGACHAGIDAFLSRALGTIERIAYVWQQGEHRPSAVLTAGGADYEVVFPNTLMLTNCNLYLRADPARLTAEPYTSGWLFEGTPREDTARGLMQGEPARQWMEAEQRRISDFLQAGSCTAADGGIFAEGLPRILPSCRMRALFHEFFSPYAGKQGS
jgi:glycine cleavage system H lipoate-binding protein